MSDVVPVSDRHAAYQRAVDTARLALGRGDKPGAEQALADAVEASTATEGLEREHANVLVRLGGLYQELGRLDDAASILQRGLVASEALLGADHPDLVAVLNELSKLHLKRLEYATAEPLLVRLIALKRAKGDQHPEVATVLSGLATVRERLGDHASAETLYREALAIRENTLAPNHIAIANTLEHVADTCAARGRLTEALVLLRRALPIRENALGGTHPTVRELRERIADFEMQESEEELTVQARTPPRSSTAVPGPMTAAPVPRTPPPILFVAQAAHATRDVTVPWTTELQAMNREIGAPVIHATPVERTLAIADTVNERLEQGSGKKVLIAGGVIAIALAAFAVVPQLRSRSSLELEASGLRAQVPPPIALPDSRSVAATTTDSSKLVVAPAGSVAAPPAATSNTVASKPSVISAPIVTPPPAPSAASRATAAATTDENARAAAMKRAAATKINVPTIDVALRDPVAPAVALRDSFTSRLGSPAARDDRDPSLADAVPKLIGSAPQPQFPPQLRDRGVEGEVLVQFLVNENGRVDPSTMKVIRSPNALLNVEVKKVLPQFRFEPARGADTKPRAEWVRYVFQFHASQL